MDQAKKKLIHYADFLFLFVQIVEDLIKSGSIKISKDDLNENVFWQCLLSTKTFIGNSALDSLDDEIRKGIGNLRHLLLLTGIDICVKRYFKEFKDTSLTLFTSYSTPQWLTPQWLNLKGGAYVNETVLKSSFDLMPQRGKEWEKLYCLYFHIVGKLVGEKDTLWDYRFKNFAEYDVRNHSLITPISNFREVWKIPDAED